MKIISFVTGNIKKVQSAQEALKNTQIEVVQEDVETPEIQDIDISKVAEYSAKYAANQLRKAVIKVDVGFEIESLNGFPGPFSKFINKWLNPEKILKLLTDETNFRAKFIDVVAYCQPDQEPVSFKAETAGTIAKTPQGDNGWGIDKIFIPQGFGKTLASLSDEERINVWNKDHWKLLADYLNNN